MAVAEAIWNKDMFLIYVQHNVQKTSPDSVFSEPAAPDPGQWQRVSYTSALPQHRGSRACVLHFTP